MPDSARHLGSAAPAPTEARSFRASREPVRRRVIHGVYPARITPDSLRNDPQGVDAKEEIPRAQKIQILGKMSSNIEERSLYNTFLKRE